MEALAVYDVLYMDRSNGKKIVASGLARQDACDVAKAEAVIDRYRAEDGVGFGALRTRESGRQRFVYVTMTVPAGWTVKRAHHITERLEADMEIPGRWRPC